MKNTTIENPFGITPTGYVTLKGKLNPENQYYIINATGNCMNSDKSPIRAKDGDKMLIREIPMNEPSILANIGKLVCFLFPDGTCFYKQMFFYDVCRGYIGFKMFKPKEEKFYVPISKIKALFVVDRVLTPYELKRILLS